MSECDFNSVFDKNNKSSQVLRCSLSTRKNKSKREWCGKDSAEVGRRTSQVCANMFSLPSCSIQLLDHWFRTMMLWFNSSGILHVWASRQQILGLDFQNKTWLNLQQCSSRNSANCPVRNLISQFFSLEPLQFQHFPLGKDLRSSEFIENVARICQWGSWVPCWCCVANVFALAVIEGINSFVVVCWDRRLLDFESILVNLLTGNSKPVKNCSLST